MTINPTRQEIEAIIALCHDKLNDSLIVANKRLNTQYKLPIISFDLRGRVAGLAYPHMWKIRINLEMLMNSGRAFIDEVIPHELAHLIVHQYYTVDKKRMHIKPHGDEWKMMMCDVFKLPPKRTHNYEVPKRTKTVFVYTCQCSEYPLSIIRHNKIRAGSARYSCKKCHQNLVFTGQSKMITA